MNKDDSFLRMTLDSFCAYTDKKKLNKKKNQKAQPELHWEESKKKEFSKIPFLWGQALKLNGGKQIADLYFVTVATFIFLRNSGEITEVA